MFLKNTYFIVSKEILMRYIKELTDTQKKRIDPRLRKWLF
jgi:hypothetical protein